MIQHVKHSHPYANCGLGQNGQNSQTNLPNNSKTTKNKKIHVPVKTINTDNGNGKLKSVVYEVFQNGELVIVDGIHYFVKRKVAFIGKKHALKKYNQFALNTSCFL